MAYTIQHPGGFCRVDGDTGNVFCPNGTSGRSGSEVFRLYCTSLIPGIEVGAEHQVYLRSHHTHKFCRLDSTGQKAVLKCDALTSVAATPFDYQGSTLTYRGRSFQINHSTWEPPCVSLLPSNMPTWSFVLKRAKLYSNTVYSISSVEVAAGCQNNVTDGNMTCDGARRPLPLPAHQPPLARRPSGPGPLGRAPRWPLTLASPSPWPPRPQASTASTRPSATRSSTATTPTTPCPRSPPARRSS
jgi:hypothetical protein